jgi:hypothetical protein
MKLMDILKFVDERLGEPSTYAGLSAILLYANLNIDPGTMHTVTVWGMFASAGLAIVLKEVGNTPPLQIAVDVFTALGALLKAAPQPETKDESK